MGTSDGSPTNSPIVDPATTVEPTTPPTTEDIFRDIKSKISYDFIKDDLRLFNDKKQHLAGSEWSKNVAKKIFDNWSGLGYQTRYRNYNVMLSMPGRSTMNLSNPTSNLVEFASPVGVYTPYGLNSSASGNLIFINYGRFEDYAVLNENGKYQFSQHNIALARMGKMPLSAMAKIAEMNGIKGMIVFADPTDYAPKVNFSDPKTKTSEVFPNTEWLPPDTVVQESILLAMGDPFSSGFASGIDNVIDRNQTDLVNIPVISVGYQTAYEIFNNLHQRGPGSPDWLGNLGNYNIEAGSTQNLVVNIDIQNTLEQKEIQNVVATIRGSVEPGQYVIIGGHRDSAGVGTTSPGTGLACLLEVSRLLHFIMHNRKWKPYRSIMLVSWDAGASGQIGSTEWVEEKLSLLQESVVAYINLDDAVVGNYVFKASGSPLLSKVVYEASKKVDCPNHKDTDIFTDWTKKSEDKTLDNPSLSVPGTNTDANPFLHLVGVPTIAPSYTYDKKTMKDVNGNERIDNYALYNTNKDTMDLLNKFDSNLDFHKAVIEVTLRILYEIADKPVLPFSVVNYADAIIKEAKKLLQNCPDTTSLDQLVTAAESFKKSAEAFTETMEEAIRNNDVEQYPSINFKFLALEKMFLSKQLRQPFSEYRHLMMGPTLQKAYSGAFFPAISDALAVCNPEEKSFTRETAAALLQASHLLTVKFP